MKGIHKHKILLIPLSMLAVTLIAGYFLSHIPLGANAVTTSDVSLRVKDTCTMDGNVTTDDSNMLNGQEREGFHVLSLTTYCNDNAGFSIYAVGYSGDLEGSTDLTGATTGLTISTADWADRNTGDNATKSIYSLKIEKDNTSYLPGNISILNGFTDYLAVPSTNTKVASYSSNTDTTTGSTINANYAVKVANLQAADTYTGKVKYTMVHPSSNTATGFTFDDAFQLAGKSRVSGTSYFAMQDMNAAICNKVTTNQASNLIDIRDNKVYSIAKLLDGRCWMTSNLDLAGGTALYSDTSNVAPANTIASGTPYYTLPATQIIANNETYALNGGFDDSTYVNGYVFNSGNGSDADCAAGKPCYSYYSYNAATASSGVDIGTNDTDAPYSICPKGWKLPTSRSTVAGNSDFYRLAVAYGMSADVISETTTIFNTNAGIGTLPNFIHPGVYLGSDFTGLVAGYWSATVRTGSVAFDLDLSQSRINTAYGNARRFGFSVRCIVDDSMQSFDQDAAASLAINESLQLRDVRDGKEYWVTKLADGNVWMTQNLDFDITGPLDSTTTNLTVAGVAPYTTGYAKDETTGKITWTPSATTISAPAINQSFAWSDSYNNPASVDLGDWYYRSDYYNNDDCGDSGCDFHTGNAGSQFSQTPGANGAHSHVGNYYNWSAAVASSDTSGYNSGNAANSLCPANWNLPVNGMYGTLNSLYNPNITIGTDLGATAAADKALLAAPLYFVRAGFVWGSALHGAGVHGVYWPSTVYDSSGAYSLLFRSSGVWPATGNNRNGGLSLRCVLRGN